MVFFLLLVSIACGQDTDATFEPFPPDSMGPPLPESASPEPSPAEAPAYDVSEQRNEVREEAVRASGLAFYLEDKAAKKKGDLPEEWEQPPLSTYKEQPWCHAPVPHGKHTPEEGDFPSVEDDAPEGD